VTKNEFYSKWLRHFAAKISESDLEKYVVSTGNLIWHVFSWDLLDNNMFSTGNDAKAAYDTIDKQGALYIEWFQDEQTKDISPSMHTASTLDKMVEVYVVASDFSWTYIKTHESTCGPYFMKSCIREISA